MAAWARLIAPLAFAIQACPALAQQGQAQPEPAYQQIVSAAQDCLDSYERGAISEKQLRKRGWQRARLEGMGELQGIMKGFVRGDIGILHLRYSCIVKAQLRPPASADTLALAFSDKWSVEPTPAADGTIGWDLPERRIELTPGPADGSNVSVTVSLRFEGVD